MVEISKIKNSYNYDVFKFKMDDGAFEISRQGNNDLYWRYITNDSEIASLRSYTLSITKENYFLYELFNELYNSIIKEKPYANIDYNDEFLPQVVIKHDLSNKKSLVKNNVIDWHSDEFIYENASRIIIQKVDDDYKLTFVKSKKAFDNGKLMTFSICFSNDSSRYYPYNNTFMYMYNKLKQYDIDFNQMHIEEYLYAKKLSKKRN